MNLLLGLYVVILLVFYVCSERIQLPDGCHGWVHFVGMVVIVGSLGALVAGFMVGERRVEVAVSRDAGVACSDCGAAPRAAEMSDWIGANSCLECGGRLHGDFSNLRYKDSWPEWDSHECEVDEESPREG